MSHRNSAGVGRCTLVSADFFYLLLLYYFVAITCIDIEG